MTGTVSVIIAAYNAAGFIARAIDSALAQTLPPLEIIIADDCSTDGTRDVLAAAAAANPSLKIVLLKRNGGPSVARNAAIAQATGDWLAVLDADDAFAPDRLARLVEFAEARHADFVADDLAYYDAAAGVVTGAGIGAAPPIGPVTLRDYLAHNIAGSGGLDWGLLKPMFSRNMLANKGMVYDPAVSHGEDFRLVVELLLRGARFSILPEPLYLYTQREGAKSKRSSGMTRTHIAYDKLSAAALALARDPRIAGDAKAVGYLQARARGLDRLDDAQFFAIAVRAGAVGRIARRCLQNPAFVPFMFVLLARAVGRRVA